MALNFLMLVVVFLLYSDVVSRRKKFKANVIEEAQKIVNEEHARNAQREQLLQRALLDDLSLQLKLNDNQKQQLHIIVRHTFESHATPTQFPFAATPKDNSSERKST
jgi:hypothetical protein